MKSKTPGLSNSHGAGRRGFAALVLALNVVLLAAVVLLYGRYNSLYSERLKEENLGNIANMNRAAVTGATSLLTSWQVALSDIAKYAELHEFTPEQALQLIDETNSSADRHFELIGPGYTGWLARRGEDGGFPALDYSSNSYKSLQAVLDAAAGSAGDAIRFTPEFTDGATALKFFAVYRPLALRADTGEPQSYTLLLASPSKAVLSVLNSQSDYDGQSTVLIDAAGNYIVGNTDFKSANFFDYLYTYNDLSLDEKNAVRAEMTANGCGELYFKNAGAVVEDCVFRYERMDDSGWYCITCVPLSSFHVPAFKITYVVYAIALLLVLFAVDLTWLQSVNRRLRVSMLREKQASAAKGNFMSRMSHEIRTPLNAVIGYNTIARSEMADAKSEADRRQAEMKVMDCLTKSDIASKHLLTIINDVLDMSAIESGKIKVARERFDFRGLITSLTTIFYSQAQAKGIDFEVRIGTLTEEWFTGDQMRTNQILTNLLSNAVKFTPEGGSVCMTITQPEAGSNDCHLRFIVQDTGIGMTPEYLSHIWTPFEQADSTISRRFGGTGLGLAITKNLVDLMDGTIAVASAPGAGTTFTVDLTFERAAQPDGDAAYDFGSVNALIVDDDRSTCDYIKLLFDRCGAKCSCVLSGEDALAEVEQSKARGEAFTVCIVDWRMPKMDGIETAKRIRQIAGDDVPIIVLSAYDYTEVADKAADLGIYRFISKPLFPSSLFDLLADICGVHAPKELDRSTKFDFGGARVLLAEDNTMNMEIAKRIMESAGLQVDSAWNGKEAVDRFIASAPGSYRVILMDVHMPEMNGYEATQTIRACAHAEAASIPIIAMTADAFAENVAEARAAGMNEHIAKPIDPQLLFETLRRYIGGQG